MKPRIRRVVIFILFYYYCSVSSVLGTQTFSKPPPPEIWAELEKPVDIPCEIRDKEGDCSWLKGGSLITVSRNFNSGSFYKYLHQDQCSLRIKKVTQNSTSFSCKVSEITNTSGEKVGEGLSGCATVYIGARPKALQVQIKKNHLINVEETDLLEGESYTFKCSSENGLPASNIKWVLKTNDTVEKEIKSTETVEYVKRDNSFNVKSEVNYAFKRDDYGKKLICRSDHPISGHEEKNINVKVKFAPEVSMKNNVTSVYEHHHMIECRVTSNPPASKIIWLAQFDEEVQIGRWEKGQDLIEDSTKNYEIETRIDLNGITIISELIIHKINRMHDGRNYECRAVNRIGESEQSVQLEVQYGPVNPEKSTQVVKYVEYHSTREDSFLVCPDCDAKPAPSYRWARGNDRNSFSKTSVEGKKIFLNNLDWTDSGEYQCMAYNFINNTRMEASCGNSYMVNVYGRPVGQRVDRERNGWPGQPNITLEYEFCCQPPPTDIIWQWGSTQLSKGKIWDSKHRVYEYENTTNYCYVTKLEIRDLTRIDSRPYLVIVSNGNGSLTDQIKLNISESLGITNMAIAFIVGFMILLIITVCAMYALYVRRKRDDEKIKKLKAEEMQEMSTKKIQYNEKNHDNDTDDSIEGEKNFGFNMDYNYLKNDRRLMALSPEAMKVRRAPVVLQTATIV